MRTSPLLGSAGTALVIAHPGHELRVHGWLEHARPTVFVLTDGSGSRGQPRVTSTSRVLETVGASRGDLYGAVSDRELYAAILSGGTEWLSAMAASLCDSLIRRDIRVVAGDALEGFNPAHDLCRHLIDAVVHRCQRVGHLVENFAFALDAPPGTADHDLPSGRFVHELSDRALERKLAAAHGYEGLEDEVQKALSAWGPSTFRREVFWRADVTEASPMAPADYERYGEDRRSRGVYEQVIRRHEHMDPLLVALRRFAEQSTRPAHGVLVGPAHT